MSEVDNNNVALNYKQISDAVVLERAYFEFYSKARDDYAKIVINILFVLNTTAAASVPIIFKLISEESHKIPIRLAYAPFFLFSIGFCCALFSAIFTWLNFYVLSLYSYGISEKKLEFWKMKFSRTKQKSFTAIEKIL